MEGQYNLRSPAVKRLMKEAQELCEPTAEYYAQPLEDNLFEWHFTIRGPDDSEFDGGVYHGRIILPPEYPMKPPSIIILTPNGRFETFKKICLSISGHHPESWQPSWSIRTALLAIIGFMPTHGNGAIGSLDYTPEERKVLAKKSLEWKCPNCGCVKDILKPMTAASKAANQEAKELAQQINFQGEKEKGSTSSESSGAATSTPASPTGSAAPSTPQATQAPPGGATAAAGAPPLLPGGSAGFPFPAGAMPPFMPPMFGMPPFRPPGVGGSTTTGSAMPGFAPPPFWMPPGFANMPGMSPAPGQQRQQNMMPPGMPGPFWPAGLVPPPRQPVVPQVPSTSTTQSINTPRASTDTSGASATAETNQNRPQESAAASPSSTAESQPVSSSSSSSTPSSQSSPVVTSQPSSSSPTVTTPTPSPTLRQRTAPQPANQGARTPVSTPQRVGQSAELQQRTATRNAYNSLEVTVMVLLGLAIAALLIRRFSLMKDFGMDLL